MMKILNYSWTIILLEMPHDTRGNKYKLVPKLCKYELRKQSSQAMEYVARQGGVS